MPKYVLNPETLRYEVKRGIKIPRKLRYTLLGAGAVGMVIFYFWLYTAVFDWELPRTFVLRRRHAEWETKMELMERRLNIYERALSGLEERDDDVYRSYYGLSPIPAVLDYSSYDGDYFKELEEMDASSELVLTVQRMDELAKRVTVRSRSLDELNQIALNTGDMISCVPAVPPILPDRSKYHVSSRFGYRRDPVYGGGENHAGIDFAMKQGSPVYATGDAVVEKVEFLFRGYGTNIILDHGYGYKTRYAHLHTADVVEGMKVSRGQQIGTVGNTGKSTGAHLHYEVRYRGAAVNPNNYMNLEMPLEEFRAMVNKRADDSVLGKKSSTLELLRRGRSNEK